MADGKGYVITNIRQSVLSPIVYDGNGDPFVYFNGRGNAYSSDPATSAWGVDLGSGNYPNLTLYSLSAGGASCPGIVMTADSPSPADNDGLFFIDCVGKNSANESIVYATIAGLIDDVTDATEDAHIYFQTYSAGTRNTRLRIDGDGIKFGTDTATANALGDYEEGTFTPTFSTTSTDFTTVTYDTQLGYYTKIGNVVYWNVVLDTASLTVGSASGNLTVDGFPFTVSTNRQCGMFSPYANNFTTQIPTQGRLSSGTDFLILRHTNDAATSITSLSYTELGSDTQLNCLGFFYVD